MSQGVFEFYQTMKFIEYPFDARRDDNLHTLFVDAYILHNATNRGKVRLAKFDPAGLVELRFEDGELLGDLTSVDGFNAQTFGDYTLYSWGRLGIVAGGFTGRCLAVQFVVLTSNLGKFGFPVVPSAAYLSSSRVNPSILKVEKYAVALPNQACCFGGPKAGKLIFKDGFNAGLELVEIERVVVPLVEETVQARKPTVIQINLDAQAGIGQYPVCEGASTAIRTIRNVAPTSLGEYKLQGKDCTWVETRLMGPAFTPVHPNTDYLSTIVDGANQTILQLHQSCRACCDCSDYGRAYEMLTVFSQRMNAVVVRLQEVAARYAQAKGAWDYQKQTREVGRRIHSRVMARPDYYVDVAVHVTNDQTGISLPETDVEISFDPGSNPGPVYVPGTGFVEAEGAHCQQVNPSNVAAGRFKISLSAVGPGKFAVYRMSVRYTGGSRAGKTVVVTTRAYEKNAPAVGLVTEQFTTQLVRPLDKV